MTVTDTRDQIRHTGNDVKVVLSVPYPFGRGQDLLVLHYDTTTGVETELQYGPDYSVQGGGGGKDRPTSGTITTTATYSTTEDVLILRRPQIRQGVDYNQVEIPEKTHEEAFDQIAYRDQEHGANVEKHLRVTATDEFAGTRDFDLELPDAVSRADLFLGFDSSGDPEALAEPTGTAPSSLMLPFVQATSAAAAKLIIEVED
ncbi:MAG: hypothetical protein V3V08_23590 [Nannocystaceae bacterium]